MTPTKSSQVFTYSTAIKIVNLMVAVVYYSVRDITFQVPAEIDPLDRLQCQRLDSAEAETSTPYLVFITIFNTIKWERTILPLCKL